MPTPPPQVAGPTPTQPRVRCRAEPKEPLKQHNQRGPGGARHCWEQAHFGGQPLHSTSYLVIKVHPRVTESPHPQKGQRQSSLNYHRGCI